MPLLQTFGPASLRPITRSTRLGYRQDIVPNSAGVTSYPIEKWFHITFGRWTNKHLIVPVGFVADLLDHSPLGDYSRPTRPKVWQSASSTCASGCYATCD